ncbi:YHS domain-containing (seleno)protein [Roseicitreum antarcticum]|nr:YHS domain-containing (seleno)protein [Roseicitreum antarcticum]
MLHRRHMITLTLAALAAPAKAQPYLAEGGVALRGYDPVAYFTHAEPRRGDPAISAQWGGATWHFTDIASRDSFLAAPDRFAPQYGGYCAWAAAQNYLAPVDPTQWQIVDGRLYLNASARIQRRWQRDIPGHIRRADANWADLRP